MKNLVIGFREFIMRGNVVELAVAVVIGAAFTALVKAFTDGFITPLIGAIFGKKSFSDWVTHVRGQTFNWGLIINAIIVFLITAAVIYFLVVAPLNAYNARRARGKAAPDPTSRQCPYCLSDVPIAATKCAFCTSDLEAASPAT